MAKFVMKRGPSTNLYKLPISDGAFIITKDTHDLYTDIGTDRFYLGSIVEVDALPAGADIIASKYYYLKTNHHLYRYDTVSSAWIDLMEVGAQAALEAASAAMDKAIAVQGQTGSSVKDIEDALTALKGGSESTIKAVEDSIATLNGELAAVAKSGTAADVAVVDEGMLLEANTVEAALAELAGKISESSTAGKVTIETSTESSDYAKVYTFKQGEETIGTINIPKDMVVSEGTVVENPEGLVAGTYIKLVLQNVADPLYINVTSLIEYVTGGATTEITVSVDPTTHVVTAVINDGSIVKAKLDTGVQASLEKADTAVQKVTVLGTELTEGGELTVDDAKTALGLGSAAYTDADAYDAAGSAKAVQGETEKTVADVATELEALASGSGTSIADLEQAITDLKGGSESTIKEVEDNVATQVAAIKGGDGSTTATLTTLEAGVDELSIAVNDINAAMEWVEFDTIEEPTA